MRPAQPGFYLAVSNFHTQILPTMLLLSFADARSGVPFPAVVEVILDVYKRQELDEMLSEWVSENQVPEHFLEILKDFMNRA